MGDAEAQQALLSQQYPNPPEYWKLFADPALAPAPPPAPPADGHYEAFGGRFTVQPPRPSLQEGGVPQLYDAKRAAGGGEGAREELRKLNRSLLFNYIEMVRTLVEHPEAHGERLEAVGSVARNMHHLLNSLRPAQAKATLLYVLKAQIEEKKQALQEVRQRTEAAQAFLSEDATAMPDEVQAP